MGVSNLNVQVRGTLLSAAGMAIISPDGLLIKLIGRTDIWTIIVYRLGLIAVSLSIWLALRYRSRMLSIWRGIGWPGVIAILCMACAGVGFVTAMRRTTVADTLMLFATMPLWSALIGRLLIGERVRRRTLCAMVVALCGIVVIVGGALGRGALLGDVIALATAISNAAALVAVRKAGDRDMTPVVAGGSALAALIVLPFASPLAINAHDLGILAFLGLIQQPLALGLFLSGARYIPAAEVALLALVETVLGPLWAWLGLGEVPPPGALLGGTIVVAAIVGNNLLAERERRRSLAAQRLCRS